MLLHHTVEGAFFLSFRQLDSLDKDLESLLEHTVMTHTLDYP